MSRKHSVVDQTPWDDLQTSSTTKTTTMTTAAKLYGKDLSEYDDIDVDKLLAELTPEELNILAKEVDPDVSIFALKRSLAILIPRDTESVMYYPGQLYATFATLQLRVQQESYGTTESQETHWAYQ